VDLAFNNLGFSLTLEAELTTRFGLRPRRLGDAAFQVEGRDKELVAAAVREIENAIDIGSKDVH